MSLFGKVLAILNILAVGAFAYLTMMAMSQRAKWAYAAFEYQLAIEGLPVDKKEVDENGELAYKKISPGVQKKLGINFQTMTEAADSLVSKSMQTLQNASKETQTQKEIRIALLLARTASDRKDLWDLYVYENNPAAPLSDADRKRLEDLKKALPTYLSDRLKRYSTGGLDRAATRREIGDMYAALMDLHVTPAKPGTPTDYFNSPYYREMVRVLGVRQTSEALNKKAAVLIKMTDQLRDRVRPLIRTGFVAAHDDLLRQIRDMEILYRDQQKQVTVKEAQAELVRKRADAQLVHVENKTRELEAARKDSEKLLNDLAAEQKRLFDTLTQLRDVNAQNQRLEKDIRRLENQLP